MQQFKVIGVKIKELNTAKQIKRVFSIVILLNKGGVNKLKKLPKLGRYNRALKGLNKVNSKILFI